MEAFAIPVATDGLTDVVDALVGESIEGFSTQALGEDIIGIRRAVDRLEAECLRRLHRFDQGHGAADEGSSTISWMRRYCAMTGTAAASRVHLARTLGELPATLDSARAGLASLSNVSLIASLAGDVGVERVAPLEHILLGAAETFDAGDMRRLTAATRLRLDPDGVLGDDNRAYERRGFDCDQTYGGIWHLRGQLDSEGGAVVKTVLDALTGMPSPDDPRSGSQRRADALVDLAAMQLRGGELPEVHGQRPHLTVTVTAETLRSEAVVSDGLRSDGPGSGLRSDGLRPDELRSDGLPAGADVPPAEMEGVGLIHPETARRIACDAVRTVVLVAPRPAASIAWALDGHPLPLSVGRATRTIPAHLRTALRLRDRGCRFPGCDRPPAWTDGHHIEHWADGGATALENLVSLCRRHHRVVHEEGWRIHIADGIAVVEEPPP